MDSTPTFACPPDAELERSLQAPADSREFEVLESHLLTCEACARRTLSMAGVETVLSLLREGASCTPDPATVPASRVRELVAKMSRLPESLSLVETRIEETDPKPGAADWTAGLQPPQGADEIGRIGGYRVLKLLGAGGMGGVFLAEDLLLHRQVALKVLRPEIAHRTDATDRFLREARAAAALRHDHIITIFQVGLDHGVPFLAMELLHGESLEDRLRRSPELTYPEILRIGREIAEGLAAAHGANLIHRDIKPANVWLEGQRARVKLLDFGLARSTGNDITLTAAGTVMGTPAYMAPEQASGKTVDHRADLFSLGVVLYRVTTGRLPFAKSDTIATLLAICSESPTDPRQLKPDLVPELAELINRLMEKDPANRPSTATEVIGRLAQLEHPPLQAVQRTVAEPARPRPRAGIWRATFAALAGVLLFAAVFVIVRDKYGKEVGRASIPEGGSLAIEVSPPTSSGAAAEPSSTAIKSPKPETGAVAPQVAVVSPVKPVDAVIEHHLPRLAQTALVSAPAVLDGVESWSVETLAARGNLPKAEFAPDSQQVATFGSDGVIRIFDCESGQPVQFLIGHGGPIAGITWLPHGKRLVSSGTDGTVVVWDIPLGKKFPLLTTSFEVEYRNRKPAISPNGKLLCKTSSGLGRPVTLDIWDLNQIRLVDEIPFHDTSFLWWRDDQTVISFDGSDNTLRQLNVASRQVIKISPEPVGKDAAAPRDWNQLVWNGDRSRFGAMLSESTFGIWDSVTGKLLKSNTEVPLRGAHEMVLKADQFVLLRRPQQQGLLEIQAIEENKVINAVRLTSLADGLHLSGDGRWLLSLSQDRQALQLYDVQANKLQWEQNRIDESTHEAGEYAIWSPQGHKLLTGTTPRIWDLDTARVEWDPELPPSWTAAWSSDAGQIAVSSRLSDSSPVNILDVAQRRKLVDLPAINSPVGAIAWSRREPRLAALDRGNEPRIRIYNAKTWQTEKEIATGPRGSWVGWNADESLIAAEVAEGLDVYDTENGKLASRVSAQFADWLPGHNELVLSTDTLRLCEVRSSQSWPFFQKPRFTWISGFALAPDGKTLALGLIDGRIEIRNTESGDYLTQPEGVSPLTQRVNQTLAWSPDGKMLAASLDDGGQYSVWSSATWKSLGRLIPLGRKHYAAISRTGHYTGSRRADANLVYVVRTSEGQTVLTPSEFAEKYGWKNDPAEIRIDPAPEPATPTAPPIPTIDVAKLEPGTPLRADALVSTPLKLPGVISWNLETRWHRSAIHSIESRPDGQQFATGDDQGTVRIWDSRTRAVEKILMPPDRGRHEIKWSPDGKQLATWSAAYGRLSVWNVATGKRLQSAEPVPALAAHGVLDWSNDGELLLVGNTERVALLQATSLEKVDDFSPAAVVRFAPDGRRIAGMTGRGTIEFWETRSLRRLPELKNPPEAKTPADAAQRTWTWSPDGKSIAVASSFERMIWVVDSTNGDVRWERAGLKFAHTYRSNHCWSPDGLDLMLCLDSVQTRLLRVSAADGTERYRRTMPLGQLRTVIAWVPGYDLLCLSSLQETELSVVDAKSGEVLELAGEGQQSGVNSLTLKADGKTLQCHDSQGRAYTATPWDSVPEYHFGAVPGRFRADPAGLTFVDDESRFVKQPKVDGPQTPGNLLNPVPDRSGPMQSAWNATGTIFAISELIPEKMSFYEYPSGKLLNSWSLAIRTPCPALAISPDGKKLACSLYSAHPPITIRRISDGEILARGPDEAMNTESLAWSPDGLRLASGTIDGRVRIWNADLSRVELEFTAHAERISSLLWSADGEQLLTGGGPADGTIRAWNARTGKPAGTLLRFREDHYVQVAPTGHYRVSPSLAWRELLYVVETEDGQETLHFPEFEARYGWKNRPEMAVLPR